MDDIYDEGTKKESNVIEQSATVSIIRPGQGRGTQFLERLKARARLVEEAQDILADDKKTRRRLQNITLGHWIEVDEEGNEYDHYLSYDLGFKSLVHSSNELDERTGKNFFRFIPCPPEALDALKTSLSNLTL